MYALTTIHLGLMMHFVFKSTWTSFCWEYFKNNEIFQIYPVLCGLALKDVYMSFQMGGIPLSKGQGHSLKILKGTIYVSG